MTKDGEVGWAALNLNWNALDHDELNTGSGDVWQGLILMFCYLYLYFIIMHKFVLVFIEPYKYDMR
jgi:hypothetical protein